ncbi:phosphopantetheine-binding protein [Eubacteriaceae bacterium ES2]|nr:phosphopantetheine-binding protein [Eubacteriaceae bacterium ES2]
MDKNTITDKIFEMCATTYQKEKSELSVETRFDEDLSPNSIMRVALSANVEENLDVMVPLPDMSKMKTVGDLIDFVDNELKA